MTHEPSEAQKQYLHSLQRRKYWILAAQVLLLLAILAAWEISVEKGYLNGFIFSSPRRVVLCFYTMLKDQSLFFHIGITLAETIASFLLVMILTL